MSTDFEFEMPASDECDAELEQAERKKGNKTTVTLSQEMYTNLISIIKNGFYDKAGHYHRPNERIAMVLQLEAVLGMRISDIMALTPESIIQDGPRYRLDVVEIKTGKARRFTVPEEVKLRIENYILRHNIARKAKIFPITKRQVNKHLSYAAETLGYENIGTHSFRRFFATSIYVDNNYDILLVQKLLQHSSVAITQRYIGIGSERMEKAIEEHIRFVD